MTDMLELLVRRQPTVKLTTFGDLFVGGKWQCHTLEDPIREIPGRPVEEWKVWGQTAIPAGKYRVVLVNSPKFGPDTLSIEHVPGFTDIRIHAGNDDADTHGCLLVGRAIVPDPDGDGGDVTGSKPALAALKARLVPLIKSGTQVWITYENPLGGT